MNAVLFLCCLFANFILSSCESGVEEKNRENHLFPFDGNPSHHGSEVNWQIITSDTIDKSKLVIVDLLKNSELALINDPKYISGGKLL